MRENNSQSAYIKIHYAIANDIAMGIYKIGDLIPTQIELSQKYNVSRVTISETIKELTRRGILKTQKGKGTYVAATPLEIGNFQRFEGFSKFSSQNKDKNLTSRVIVIERIPAPERVSRLLKVEEQTMVSHIVRVRAVNGVPMSYESSYLLNRYVEQIDFTKENLETGSLYALLKNKAGLSFSYSKEKIRATYCPETVAELLGLSKSEPILAINRVCGTDDEHLVECIEIYERSDMTYTSYQSVKSEEGEKKTPDMRRGPEWEDKVANSLMGASLADGNFYQRFLGKWNPEQIASVQGIQEESFDAAVAARAYGYDEDDIISSGEFLANFFPLFYVGKGNWDYAVQNLAKFMIYKGYHTGEISAACGFVAALAACFHNDGDVWELAERAKQGAKEGAGLALEAGLQSGNVNVEKRIDFAMNLARDKEDWKETLESYKDILGEGEEAEFIVPAVLCSLAAGKGDYLTLLKEGRQLLKSSSIWILFGALAGAYYSRTAFSERDSDSLSGGSSPYYEFAHTLLEN